VVLERSGDAFTAGGDVEMLREHLDAQPPAPDRDRPVRANEHATVQRLVEYPLPTVAKVDGLALGDGANLAIACDVPLASERTRIAFSHVRFGLSMDTGDSYLLPRVVGRGMAKELAYTGHVVDAEEAHELGLVNHVYPVESF